MTTYIDILALISLLAGLVALISFARHDRFTGLRNATPHPDELGTLAFRRRPV